MGVEATLISLVVVASAVAMVVRRWQLPYTVALVITGLLLGYGHTVVPGLTFESVRLTPDLLFTLFLPVLLFEAAFHLSFDKFKKNVRAIMLLALPGVAAAVGITGSLVYALEPVAPDVFPLAACFLFAAIVAATDPVSVIALFKDLGAPKRLGVLMEGESLLNDGVAVVAFVAIAASMGVHHAAEPVSVGWIVRFFLWEILGGLGIGMAVGLAISYVTSLIEDHLIEITLTTIAAFGSYLLADAIHVSGVIAVVVAGMLCGNVGAKFGMGPSTRIAVVSFWEYAVFAANSFVFLLLGKEIDALRLLKSGHLIVIAWLVLLVARTAVILIVERLLASSTERLPSRWSLVLIWGGLRGGLSMVLALSLPDGFGPRELILDLTFGVVFLSIIVQGMTMGPLVRWLGIVTQAEERRRYQRLRGRIRATKDALRALEETFHRGEIHRGTFDVLRARLEERLHAFEAELDELHPKAELIQAEEIRLTEERLYAVERDALRHAMEAGIIADDIARELLRDVDERELAAEEEPIAPPAEDETASA